MKRFNSNFHLSCISSGFSLRYGMYVLSHSVCPIVHDPMDCSPAAPRPRNFLGKNTGVGCHFLLQGIFPIQGLNPGLLGKVDSLPVVPPGKPINT